MRELLRAEGGCGGGGLVIPCELRGIEQGPEQIFDDGFALFVTVFAGLLQLFLEVQHFLRCGSAGEAHEEAVFDDGGVIRGESEDLSGAGEQIDFSEFLGEAAVHFEEHL